MKLAYGLYCGTGYAFPNGEEYVATRTKAQAMLCRYPGAVVARRAAAALHGLWLIHPVGRVELYRAEGWMREKHDVEVTTVDLPPDQVTIVDDVPVTSLTRTCADILSRTTPPEGLAVADSALRLGARRIEIARLIPPGDTQAHRVLTLADRRSESALESVSRWGFHLARLPAPERQVEFELAGGTRARVDFFWRRQRIVGEADGALKYDEEGRARTAEEERQERLERLGLQVIRWGWNDVMGDASSLVARLRDVL